MTTIAWDGQLLCTDSMAIGSHIFQGQTAKIFTFADGQYRAIAFAGNTGDKDVIVEWLRGQRERPKGSDFSALVVDEAGECWIWDSEACGRIKAGTPDARGSGSDFAMGAMLAGASAFRAVEIASRLDECTGGAVQCYSVVSGLVNYER